MGKKKRKKFDPAKKTAVVPQEFKKHPHRMWLIAGVVLVIVIAAGVIGMRRYHRSGPSFNSEEPSGVIEPPNVDLKSAESEVARKIERLLQEVKQNPQSADTWGLLAMNLDVHDFKQQAVPCYKQATSLSSQNFKWTYYYAVLLNELGSSESLEWFERSIKINKEYAPLYVRYGNALYDHGKHEQAVQAFQRALEQNSRMLKAMIGLARVELAQNNLEGCLKFLEQAFVMNPNIGEIQGLFSEVYRRKNEIEKAQRAAELASQLPKKAVLNDPVYSEIALEGVSSTWYESRGRAYLERGMYSDASNEFQSALKIKPEARIYDALGLALQQAGKVADAIQQHRHALELNPEEAITWNNLASALFTAGNSEEAIEAAEQGRLKDPGLPYSYINLGRFYRASGDNEKAISIYRQGLQKNPGHRRLQQNLDEVLSQANDN